MTYRVDSLKAEIKDIENFLDNIPDEDIITRSSFEDRLKKANENLNKCIGNETKVASLTFRGNPVLGTHGIFAEFGCKAASLFSNAFIAAVSALKGELNSRGPFPDKEAKQLIISGTVVGSFGFKFDLPSEDLSLFEDEEKDLYENALDKIIDLWEAAANGSDDILANILEDIHPRAVDRVREFLNYLYQEKATCGLEMNTRYFKYTTLEQLSTVIKRLKSDNINEREIEANGKIVGALPRSKTFNFVIDEVGELITGKISGDISDVNYINKNYLFKTICANFKLITVGDGRPRYILTNIKE